MQNEGTRSLEELIDALHATRASRRQLQADEADLLGHLSLELIERLERAYAIQKGIIRKRGLYYMFPRLLSMRFEAQLYMYAIIGFARFRPVPASLLRRVELFEQHSWT